MEMLGLKFVGIGVISLGMAAAAIAVSNIFSALLGAIARNPSATEQMQKMAIIGAGLAEAMGLFAFVLAMIVIFL